MSKQILTFGWLTSLITGKRFEAAIERAARLLGLTLSGSTAIVTPPAAAMSPARFNPSTI